ncbi:MAG: hypothetical protein CMH26_09385 [Micavibrio sp.]|nr:hypothetical protein [Micavibrio sp.]|tara:strand:- start:1508 stop:2530 length:1023 start_codon:yes stop_codon:yes gene_type:complete
MQAALKTPNTDRQESYDNIQDFNEEFTRDVIEHKLGNREGGLGEWEYSDPEFEGDLVNGSQDWVNFINDNPIDYYIPSAEIILADQASEIITDIVPEPVTLCFLGIGDAHIFREKDMKLATKFNNVTSATTYDISLSYLMTSVPVMASELPSKTECGMRRVDLFRGFTIAREPKSKALLTSFGGTLLNAPIERDKAGNLLTPEKSIRDHFRAIRGSMKKGDFFVFTQDGNTDKNKIERAYAGQGKFASNLAHRIKRDTPYKKIDTENTPFRVEFDSNSGILAHYLTLDFNNGDNGPKEYLINSSPKIPEEICLDWAKKEKLARVQTISHNGVHLHITQAI